MSCFLLAALCARARITIQCWQITNRCFPQGAKVNGWTFTLFFFFFLPSPPTWHLFGVNDHLGNGREILRPGYIGRLPSGVWDAQWCKTLRFWCFSIKMYDYNISYKLYDYGYKYYNINYWLTCKNVQTVNRVGSLTLWQRDTTHSWQSQSDSVSKCVQLIFPSFFFYIFVFSLHFAAHGASGWGVSGAVTQSCTISA